MAIHHELKSGKTKKFINDLTKDFFDDEYMFATALRSDINFAEYEYKNIKIMELRDKESQDFDRIAINIPKKEMPKTIKKWVDEKFFNGEEENNYYFEIALNYNETTKRKTFFVA